MVASLIKFGFLMNTLNITNKKVSKVFLFVRNDQLTAPAPPF